MLTSYPRGFNETFYEILIPVVKAKLPEFKAEELLSLFISANRPKIKKREICREILSLAIEALPKLPNVRLQLGEKEFQVFVYNYFKAIESFIYKPQQLTDFKMAMLKACSLDIEEISQKHAYLLPEVRKEGDIDIE